MLNRKEIVGLALGILLLLPVKSFASDLFSPFQTSDWAGMGLTAVADFSDLDSSYSENLYQQHLGVSGGGECNPLIRGLFGTKYPTALDYTAFGALELLTQSLIALALPERWRGGAWSLFVGIGAADTVMNSYRGGVTFRF